jgi:hypothetical protein
MVLIDGHNVLFAMRAGRGRSRGGARRAFSQRAFGQQALPQQDSHARQLVELAAGVVRSRAFGRRQVVIVCDGPPPPGIASEWPRASEAGNADARVRLHFAGPGKEADDALRDMLLHTLRPRDITVVSSDRAVLRSAEVVHAKSLSTPELLAMLVSDATTREARENDDFRLSPTGLAAWMKYFEGPREPLTKKQKKRGARSESR